MIHLIVGNTGAGKTTYSNKLKRKTNGIIFSIDKWNKNSKLCNKIIDQTQFKKIYKVKKIQFCNRK